jgi:hypothetical protein
MRECGVCDRLQVLEPHACLALGREREKVLDCDRRPVRDELEDLQLLVGEVPHPGGDRTVDGRPREQWDSGALRRGDDLAAVDGGSR